MSWVSFDCNSKVTYVQFAVSAGGLVKFTHVAAERHLPEGLDSRGMGLNAGGHGGR